MKKGMNEEAGIPVSMRGDRLSEFAFLKDCGYDGIELVYEHPFSNEEISAVLDAKEKTGLEVIGLVTPLLWSHTLSSNDPSEREQGKELVKDMITLAKTFGAESILCVPGLVDENTTYSQAYANAQTALKELVPFIEKEGIYVLIENVWNKFLITPLEMAAFIDGCACPYIGSYFDAGNVLVNSYPEYWIEILGERIKKLHIKDFSQSVGNINGFCHLFCGDMNWSLLMKSLKKVGYDGYVTIEVPYYKDCPEKFLRDNSEALDIIFTK